MTLQLLLSIVVPVAIGFILICIFWPDKRPVRSDFLFKLSLSVGPGFGFLSALYFLQLSLMGPSRKRLVAGIIALAIALVAFFSYRVIRLKGSPAIALPNEPAAKTRLERIIHIAFFIAMFVAFATFIFFSLMRPHGEWDAWAVFNMKARFLFRAGDQWRDLFSAPLQWSGPDYPLLLSAATAACWTLLSRETLAVSVAIACLFTFATAGVLVYSVSMLRGRTQGYLAGLILLCTPFFILHGANQYTDIPVGFFYLSTIALLSIAEHVWDKDNKLLILAGVMAGLSAWTKNEGLLFILLVVVSLFVVRFRSAGVKTYLKQMIPFAAGLLPVLLLIIYFKATIAASNGYLAPLEEPNALGRIMDFSRYRTIADYLITKGLAFGAWPVMVIPLLAFYLLLLGARVEQERKRTIVAWLMVLGLMLAGFLMIYVISSRDIDWLIVTSLDRLLAQLWPGFLFVFFQIVKTPQEALMGEEVVPAPKDLSRQQAAT